MKKKLFKNIVKDPEFYKRVVLLALPIAFQNVIVLAVGMADTLMLGRADSTGLLLSASSLANQPFSLMSVFCFGLSGGTSVLCTQYYGRGDKESIRTVFSMVLRGAVYMTLIFSATVLAAPSWVMSLFTNNEGIIRAGAEYLGILGWGYVFFGISYTLQCMLRTVAKVNISVVAVSLKNVFNIFGNWVLIYGNLGFEPMGIKGAAIATLIARLVEFAVMCIYVFVVEKDIGYRISHVFLKNKTLFRDLCRYGAPVFANEAIWSLAMAVQASIIGHIDYTAGDPVAANAISDIINQMSTLGIWGIATGAAVLVGSAIGEGEIQVAKERAHTFQYIAVAVGLAAMMIIYFIRDPVLNIYDLEAPTRAIAVDLINITAVMQVFVMMSAVSIVGTLRSGGDTVFCFVSETITLWLVSIPAAFVLMYFYAAPVWLVMLAMKFCELLKAVICHLRIVSGKFINSVAREKEELTA